ncbi:MAG: VOC family protein, partial [Candidatus Rokuibacteriota bacterium]
MLLPLVRSLHHVALVVRRLAEAYRFYRDTLGLPLLTEATIPEQGVRAALLAAG